MSLSRQRSDAVVKIYNELASGGIGAQLSQEMLLALAASLERATNKKPHLHIVRETKQSRFGVSRHSEPVDQYISSDHGWGDIRKYSQGD
jgi:hypothetical protein